jgi:hypothetical protein
MTFTSMDKRLVERKDLAFQEKYMKDSARHTPDASDKFEAVEVEHNPIGLCQKNMGAAKSAPAASEETSAKAAG